MHENRTGKIMVYNVLIFNIVTKMMKPHKGVY